MSNYIRCYRPGGCYFFTVVTHHRRPLFANKNHIMLLKSAFKKVKEKFPFSMNAFVILPDHLHCLWKLPENDSDYSTKLPKYFGQNLLASSLNENCYQNNPNFLRFTASNNLNFHFQTDFTKETIKERQNLYLELAKLIWNTDNFQKYLI